MDIWSDWIRVWFLRPRFSPEQLGKLPGKSDLVFYRWLMPRDETALNEWKRIIGRLDIELSPFSDAAELVSDKLGQFDELSRKEVAAEIRNFIQKFGIGPTVSLDLSGEESVNVHRMLQHAAIWCDFGND